MSGALDILVVDDRPETVRFLTEFLLQRCRRVDVAASVKEAMTFITRRQAAGEGYNLIFSDFVMPGADGLSFLRELRMRKDETPFVFITGYRSLNPALDTEAKRLNVLTILDKPIELREVEQLLNQATASFRRSKEQSGDVPFFGTSRTMRRPTAPSTVPPTQPSQALEPRNQASAPAEPLAMPAISGWQAPGAALEPRQPEALKQQSLSEALRPQPAAPPQPDVPMQGYQRRPSAIVAVGSTTARIRRGVSPTAPPQQGTGRVSRMATPQPATSFTARIRRGVEGTGAIRNPAARTESGRMFTCTNCTRSFLTLAKAEAYTTVCVHCGQLQRIEPA
jgi:CheY-like chemotaxis protein